jgi:hypothetical protein
MPDTSNTTTKSKRQPDPPARINTATEVTQRDHASQLGYLSRFLNLATRSNPWTKPIKGKDETERLELALAWIAGWNVADEELSRPLLANKPKK